MYYNVNCMYVRMYISDLKKNYLRCSKNIPNSFACHASTPRKAGRVSTCQRIRIKNPGHLAMAAAFILSKKTLASPHNGYSLSVDVLSLSEMPWQGTSVLVCISATQDWLSGSLLVFSPRIGTGSNRAFIILILTGSCWLPLLASASLGICLKRLGHQMD
jgi:hypothetical protein